MTQTGTMRLSRMAIVAAAIAAALFAATSPFAQRSGEAPAVKAAAGQALTVNGREVARLRNVEGNVLVSQESGLASGEEAARVQDGSRVITTSKAHVEVVFDDGCVVRLEENQRLEIDSGSPCNARVAESILPAGTSSSALAWMGGSFGFGFTTAAGVTGIGIIVDDRESDAVSPS